MPRRPRSQALGLALAILAGSTLPITATATPFFSELVDNGEIAGLYTSIALDSRSQPVIAYQIGISGDLRLATREGGSWNIETVDGTGITGFYNSLELDAQDNPHIAYYDFSGRKLKYAAKSGGVWSIQTVDSIGSVGKWCSLALDASGRPHISYYDQSNKDLKYAVKFGSWFRETVDATGVVGQFTSIDVTPDGYPHISYYDSTNADLKFASNFSGWNIEQIEAGPEDTGAPSAVKLDAQSAPHVAYCRDGSLWYAQRNQTFNDTWDQEAAGAACDEFVAIDVGGDGEPRAGSLHRYGPSHSLRYGVRDAGAWAFENVERTGSTGEHMSLVIDRQGNSVLSYYDSENGDLRMSDAAVILDSPSGGETWPVGGLRDILWSGVGPVDVELSLDGGRTFDTLIPGVIHNRVQLRVPHAPTRFAQMRVRRASPLSTSESDSLFTIDADISLLMMAAAAAPSGPGILVSWSTDPAPEDLSGYRLERRFTQGAWQSIASGIRGTSYVDAGGGPGARYRLYAANHLGMEQMLGEVAVQALSNAALSAWPMPMRNGVLNVSFATAGGLGGGAGAASVKLYDTGGRLVRTLADGQFEAGFHSAVWDGNDRSGRRVVPGVYFLVARSGGQDARMKVVLTD